MRDVFLAPHQLGTGGRTAAIAEHCNLFLDLGYRPTVLTFNFAKNLLGMGEKFRAEYGLPPTVAVRNIHAELLTTHAHDLEADWSGPEDADTDGLLQQDDDAESQGYIRYFDTTGTYVKFRRWGAAGPVHTTYFRARRRSVRRQYDARGFCSVEYRYDPRTGNVNQENYFTPDGFCYLVRWLNPESGAHEAVYEFSRETGHVRRFKNNIPWHVAWLESVMAECSEKPILIAHSPGAARKVIRLADASADRVFVWHENHLSAPYRRGAAIRPEYAEAFARFTEMPRVVVATRAQADDLRDLYPRAGNVSDVPPVVRDKSGPDSPQTESGRIGVFGRLVEGKRVDHLINAMPAIVAQVPQATLHIYGDGAARKALQELADRSECADRIAFHGRIRSVGDELRRCQVTVSASEVESFGLSVAESLAAATPVVAYDINYGPRDLIQDGRDGYLVPDGDQKALRRRIVELLQDEAGCERMGQDGRSRVLHEFGEAVISRRWAAILAELGGEKS